MVKIDLYVANEDVRFGKYHFSKGMIYYARNSKSGRQLLIRDESERWFMAIHQHFTLQAKMTNIFNAHFTHYKTVFVKDFEEAREITG